MLPDNPDDEENEMIVAEQKPIEDIKRMLKDKKHTFIKC